MSPQELLQKLIETNLLSGDITTFLTELKQSGITPEVAKGLSPFSDSNIGVLTSKVLIDVNSGTSYDGSLRALISAVKSSNKTYSAIGLGKDVSKDTELPDNKNPVNKNTLQVGTTSTIGNKDPNNLDIKFDPAQVTGKPENHLFSDAYEFNEGEEYNDFNEVDFELPEEGTHEFNIIRLAATAPEGSDIVNYTSYMTGFSESDVQDVLDLNSYYFSNLRDYILEVFSEASEMSHENPIEYTSDITGFSEDEVLDMMYSAMPVEESITPEGQIAKASYALFSVSDEWEDAYEFSEAISELTGYSADDVFEYIHEDFGIKSWFKDISGKRGGKKHKKLIDKAESNADKGNWHQAADQLEKASNYRLSQPSFIFKKDEQDASKISDKTKREAFLKGRRMMNADSLKYNLNTGTKKKWYEGAAKSMDESGKVKYGLSGKAKIAGGVALAATAAGIGTLAYKAHKKNQKKKEEEAKKAAQQEQQQSQPVSASLGYNNYGYVDTSMTPEQKKKILRNASIGAGIGGTLGGIGAAAQVDLVNNVMGTKMSKAGYGTVGALSGAAQIGGLTALGTYAVEKHRNKKMAKAGINPQTGKPMNSSTGYTDFGLLNMYQARKERKRMEKGINKVVGKVPVFGGLASNTVSRFMNSGKVKDKFRNKGFRNKVANARTYNNMAGAVIGNFTGKQGGALQQGGSVAADYGKKKIIQKAQQILAE